MTLLGDSMAVLFSAWGYGVTAVELVAAVAVMTALAAATRLSRWTWPLLVAAAGLEAWLFVHFGLYASAVLQGIVILVCLNGWARWGRSRWRDPDEARPRALGPIGRSGLVVAVSLGGFVLAPWLQAFGAAASRADAFIAVGSLAALMLLARKRIEAWAAWAVTGIVAAVHFAAQDLWFAALCGAALPVAAAVGARTWSGRRRAAAPLQDRQLVPA